MSPSACTTGSVFCPESSIMFAETAVSGYCSNSSQCIAACAAFEHLELLPELAHPFKVCFTGNTLICQLCGHIPGMHIHNNQSTQGLALQLAQLAPHLVDNLITSINTLSSDTLACSLANGISRVVKKSYEESQTFVQIVSHLAARVQGQALDQQSILMLLRIRNQQARIRRSQSHYTKQTQRSTAKLVISCTAAFTSEAMAATEGPHSVCSTQANSIKSAAQWTSWTRRQASV